MRDHYQILEVPRNANSKEIKIAYRKLALRFHPDRNNGNTISEEWFKYINQSYEVLSDPAKKIAYDLKLEQEQKKRVKQNQSQSITFNKKNAPKKTYHDIDLTKMSKEQLLVYLLIKLFGK